MLQAKEHTPTFYPSIVFTFGLVVESIKEFGGASQYIQAFILISPNWELEFHVYFDAP